MDFLCVQFDFTIYRKDSYCHSILLAEIVWLVVKEIKPARFYRDL